MIVGVTSRRLASLLALLALAAAPLAGCGSSDDEEGAGTTGDTAASLDGRTFVSTSVRGHELVPGTQISLSFEDGTLGAQAGCNSMGGTYALEGGRLRWNASPAMTMIGCEPPLQRQDDWLTALLTGGVTVATPSDGTLVLSGDGVEVTLREGAGRGAHAPIVGTRWTLQTIADAGPDGTASSVPAGVPAPTLRFTSDGRAEVFAGCNSGGGRGVVRDDGFAEIGPLALTRKACDRAAMRTEQAVTAILDGRVALAFDGGGNLVVAKAGRQLIFKAA